MTLSEILDGLVRLLRRYVVMGEDERVAVALWVAHTWTVLAANVTPYLQITSAEKRSGKTRLLELLALVVFKPWSTARVSAAVLIRKIARDVPTLLLDETDAAFKGSQEYTETLRGILNAGYLKGGQVSLCVPSGKSMELRDFPVFGPKAIAGIGKLPDTIADRSIRIEMKRKAASETVERFRARDAAAHADAIYEALAKWMPGAALRLAEARPILPDELDDRAADAWEPLLAIADLAGGDWPTRARQAAISLSTGDAREDDSLSIRLLTDVRSAMKDEDRITSDALVRALIDLDDAPWGDLYGRQLNMRRLAHMLKPFGVRPHPVRFGTAVAKGYQVSDFEDAWARYCPRTVTDGYGVTDSFAPDSGGAKVTKGDVTVTREDVTQGTFESAPDSDVTAVTDVTAPGRNGHHPEAVEPEFDQATERWHVAGRPIDETSWLERAEVQYLVEVAR